MVMPKMISPLVDNISNDLYRNLPDDGACKLCKREKKSLDSSNFELNYALFSNRMLNYRLLNCRFETFPFYYDLIFFSLKKNLTIFPTLRDFNNTIFNSNVHFSRYKSMACSRKYTKMSEEIEKWRKRENFGKKHQVVNLVNTFTGKRKRKRGMHTILLQWCMTSSTFSSF